MPKNLATPDEIEAPIPGDYKPQIKATLKCTVCNHPKSDIIDQHLMTKDLTVRELVGVYGIPRSTLNRHKSVCLKSRLAIVRSQLEERKAVKLAVTTIGRVDSIFDTLQPLLQEAVADKDIAKALDVGKFLHSNIELRGKITKELWDPNNPGQGGGGGDSSGGFGSPGGRVQVIVMPTTHGKSPEEIAQLSHAPTLELHKD